MKDGVKETSEATSSHAKSSLENHRKRAAMVTEARQISEQALQDRIKRFKNGETTLNEKNAKIVLNALAKGEKISPEGTISLIANPRWGGMSGEGNYNKDFYKKYLTKAGITNSYNAHDFLNDSKYAQAIEEAPALREALEDIIQQDSAGSSHGDQHTELNEDMKSQIRALLGRADARGKQRVSQDEYEALVDRLLNYNEAIEAINYVGSIGNNECPYVPRRTLEARKSSLQYYIRKAFEISK